LTVAKEAERVENYQAINSQKIKFKWEKENETIKQSNNETLRQWDVVLGYNNEKDNYA
jgi:hypothetical protein